MLLPRVPAEEQRCRCLCTNHGMHQATNEPIAHCHIPHQRCSDTRATRVAPARQPRVVRHDQTLATMANRLRQQNRHRFHRQPQSHWRCSADSRHGQRRIRCGVALAALQRAGLLDDVQQAVDERLFERAPRCFDDVGRHTDGRPRAVAVGGVDQHPGDCPGCRRRIEDAHLVVG